MHTACIRHENWWSVRIKSSSMAIRRRWCKLENAKSLKWIDSWGIYSLCTFDGFATYEEFDSIRVTKLPCYVFTYIIEYNTQGKRKKNLNGEVRSGSQTAPHSAVNQINFQMGNNKILVASIDFFHMASMANPLDNKDENDVNATLHLLWDSERRLVNHQKLHWHDCLYTRFI